MKCPHCEYQNPNEGTSDNKCNECGYYPLFVKPTESEKIAWFRLAGKIFVKARRICTKAIFSRTCLTLLLMIGFLFSIAIIPSIIHSNSRQFDQIIWQNNKNNSSPNNPRSQMLGDLQNHYLKIGMTKQQVQHLLGVADEYQASIDIYQVGYMGLMAPDPTTLELKYSNNDILLEIKIIEH